MIFNRLLLKLGGVGTTGSIRSLSVDYRNLWKSVTKLSLVFPGLAQKVILICGHKGSYKCGIYRTVPIWLETFGKSQGLIRSPWYMWYLGCLFLVIQGKFLRKLE